MIQAEGRGFLLRTGADAPWAGWVGASFLDEGLASPQAGPGRALQRLLGLAALLPGGLELVWDRAPGWMEALPFEARQGWWEALSGHPDIRLHLRPRDAEEVPGGAFRGWLHAPEPPVGAAGEKWRQGALGWVPDRPGRWSLPEAASLALPEGDLLMPGWLWGELILPLGALGALEAEELAGAMAEAQARVERALAQRLAAGAWPDLPLQRKAAGWRLGLLGGQEYQRSGGSWETAAAQARALAEGLRSRLRTAVHLGVSSDAEAAVLLGRQAMREGHPWRMSLALPPASSSFTPGLAADPRDPSPVERRLALPAGWDAVLDHPTAAPLRIPAAPSEAAAARAAAESGLRPGSGQALRWLPPDLPPPGPFDPEHPWPAPAEYPFPTDPRTGVQVGLFEGWEG